MTRVILKTGITVKKNFRKCSADLYHTSQSGQKHHRHFEDAGEGLTENALQIKAILTGLRQIIKPVQLSIYTSSQYVYSSLTSWIIGWEENDWCNAKGKPVANKELWQQVIELLKKHEYYIFLETRGEQE